MTGLLPPLAAAGTLALLGLGQVVTRARHWLPLLIWTAFYIAGYTLLGVSKYFWYYAPLLPAFVVLVAEGAAALLRAVGRIRLPRPAAIGLAGLLVITLLAPLVAGVLAHAYLGTVANPGTWRVLVDGSVTRAWAEHHHPNWFRALLAKEGKSSCDEVGAGDDATDPSASKDS